MIETWVTLPATQVTDCVTMNSMSTSIYWAHTRYQSLLGTEDITDNKIILVAVLIEPLP